jgi:hypothetical protein
MNAKNESIYATIHMLFWLVYIKAYGDDDVYLDK